MIVYSGKKNFLEKVVDNDGIIISVKDYVFCLNFYLKVSDDLIYLVIIYWYVILKIV